MGTFVGVFLGLVFFSFGNTSLANDDKVYQLIHGVLVSMSTSFVGLLLTTRSNAKSAEIKGQLDNRKNVFYDFVQNEMMPAMGTSMVLAMTKLRETLGTFEPAFNRIIVNFKSTFDECTKNFGNNFQTTVTAVTDAARTLGGSIQAVNNNVRQQRELLDEIRSGEMMLALNSFLEACDALEHSSENINSLINTVNAVERNTQSLIETQNKFASSLTVPQTIAEKLNAILDRITTFEDSINNLGVALSQTELVSNKTINSIEQHLQSVQAKNDIAEAYVETADDKLRDLFEDHKKAIEQLHSGYIDLLVEHQAGLEKTMAGVGGEILKSRDILINKLANGFDLLSLKEVFAHLSQLPEIKNRLNELQSLISSFPPEVGKMISKYISREFNAIENLSSVVSENVAQTKKGFEVVSEQIEEKSQSIQDLSDVISNNNIVIDEIIRKQDDTISKLDRNESAIENNVNTAINTTIESVDGKLTALNSQVEKVKNDISSLIDYNENIPFEKIEDKQQAILSMLEGLSRQSAMREKESSSDHIKKSEKKTSQNANKQNDE